MTPATLEQAELAKQKLRQLLAGVPGIRGIGIAVLENGYGVKVNLLDRTSRHRIPDEVDGAPVIVDIVGIISAT
jgi:hypothetical protein